MQYLAKFVLSEGSKYKELMPDQGFILPSKNGDPIGYKGWAYCAGTKKKDFFLLYFEKDCPQVTFRGTPQIVFRGTYPDRKYKGLWFNPRNGEWKELKDIMVACSETGLIRIPSFPSNNDWGLKLIEVK